MLRKVASKVAWIGRTASMVFGLALVLALMFGVASMAFADNGDPWLLGRSNVATAITSLGGTGGVDGPMVRITNNDSGTDDTALDLNVQNGETPLRVDSDRKVANLNADLLDGQDFSAFGAAEVIDEKGPLPLQGTYVSRGGGTLIISASGSGYRNSNTHGLISMGVEVNEPGGARFGYATVYTNERNSHKAFVDEYFLVDALPAGQVHTIKLWARGQGECGTANERNYHVCTTTDSNDHFNVTVLEIPGEHTPNFS